MPGREGSQEKETEKECRKMGRGPGNCVEGKEGGECRWRVIRRRVISGTQSPDSSLRTRIYLWVWQHRGHWGFR